MKSPWRCRKFDLSEERDFWRFLKSGLRFAVALATVFVIVFVLCSAAGQPSPAPEAKDRMGGSAPLCFLHPDWHIRKSLNHMGAIQAHGWSPEWHRSRSLEHRGQYLVDIALAFIPAAACAATIAPWFFNISSCMALSVGQQMWWWGKTVVTAISATAALLWEHHYHLLQVFQPGLTSSLCALLSLVAELLARRTIYSAALITVFVTAVAALPDDNGAARSAVLYGLRSALSFPAARPSIVTIALRVFYFFSFAGIGKNCIYTGYSMLAFCICYYWKRLTHRPNVSFQRTRTRRATAHTAFEPCPVNR